MDEPSVPLRFRLNGLECRVEAKPHELLVDLIRERLGLTGTKESCGLGICGACTVLLDGEAVRGCLMLAVQAEGRSIMTVEGLAGAREGLHPLQQAFQDKHGLQCGFCTPGILLTAYAYLQEHPAPSHEEIREMLAGNLCRCTGYHFIVEAIAAAAEAMGAPHPDPLPTGKRESAIPPSPPSRGRG